jgi:anti-sigma regulatory factor (Ser/Thr protein kinase)
MSDDVRTPLETDLPREPGSGAHARRWLEDQYDEALKLGELDTAKLLTSELVNNAVAHGRGSITLRTTLDDNRLLVEVIDRGSGFEQALKKRDFEQVGGHGLEIVEAASSRWGVHEGTTHVWFELERTGPRIGTDSKPPIAD